MYKGEGYQETSGRLPPHSVQPARDDNYVPSPSANSTSSNANKLPQVIRNKKICPNVKEALRKKLALARVGTSEQNKTLPLDGMEVNQKSLVPTTEKVDHSQENGQLPPHAVQTPRDDNHCPTPRPHPPQRGRAGEGFNSPREMSPLRKMFFFRRNFTDHVAAHEGRKPHACPVCKQKFTTKRHLTGHLFVHLSREERAEVRQGWRHGCYFCKKRFPTPSKLSRHLLRHTKEKLGGRCHLCRKTFYSKQTLTRDRFLHLNDDEKVALVKQRVSRVCLFCRKIFSSNRTYQAHLVTHTKEKPFPCDQCGEQFSLKGNLTTHARIHSADPRPFKCTEGDQAFGQKVNLVTHKKTVHRKLKSFACPECPKKFGRKSDMVTHLKGVHAKIRHPCPHCGHTFTQKGSLGRHLKKVHPPG
ncbi:Zinc finger protein 37 [Folsomia candida]|uniref:Zinc finger protein 37 n=1 Tax=Folsomia candida TaxID=158441 RepID=A0A226D2L3_FOLCA|nr:Zinc finger protein 37 [Folsomia candida]